MPKYSFVTMTDNISHSVYGPNTLKLTQLGHIFQILATRELRQKTSKKLKQQINFKTLGTSS